MAGVTEIVLTGGPCAGKTTGKNYIAERLREKGVRVFCVPEVATMFIAGGISDIDQLRRQDEKKYLLVEKQMLLCQIALAEQFRRLASIFSEEKKIILYDRGPMDVKVYTPKGYFEALLKECGLTLRDARDRFHAVFHLVSAADGAEKFYTLDNNVARQEKDLDAARQIDRATIEAWLGHPHLKIIDNSTDFEGKMKRLLAGITKVLEMPVPLEIERRFLLVRPPDFNIEPLRRAQRIFVEQMYLATPTGEEVRIRRWSQGSSSIYYITRKKNVAGGVRQETEEEISASQYRAFQALRDPRSKIIRKDRHCFEWRHQYFELDVFREPRRRLCILEAELTEENDKLFLPPFLEIRAEVTDDQTYSNHHIAMYS